MSLPYHGGHKTRGSEIITFLFCHVTYLLIKRLHIFEGDSTSSEGTTLPNLVVIEIRKTSKARGQTI